MILSFKSILHVFGMQATLLVFAVSITVAGQTRERTQSLIQEEARDYYRKWLDEDVVYIITDEEREIFENLATEEEREQFIEQFWFRRDPDPTTSENEYKEEHYRRIAYANEHFRSGFPGWMTDRGRIYILHGPPDEIESHASGGSYERPMSEGGGTTSTFPFEIWRYRNIDGVGSDILLEFVDPSLSGEYRLALMPEEKDALLHVPGAGLTIAEQMGVADKADRPFFSPGNRDKYPMMTRTARDNPFNRYETYSMVQRPTRIKYKDLKGIVEVNVSYSSLPFDIEESYFHLNPERVLVPITLFVRNQHLSFREEGGMRVARLAVYGLITSITNQIVAEFEDDLVTSLSPDQYEKGLLRQSVYQKTVLLDRKMRYKLDLVVQDLNSGNTGVVRRAIVLPSVEEGQFSVSSLLLSGSIQVLDRVSPNEMFVLGDVKILPSPDKVFRPDQRMGVYLQLYNAEIDQSTLEPSLSIEYKLVRRGETVRREIDRDSRSIQFFSGQRVVLIRFLSLEGLESGHWILQVEATDRLDGDRIQAEREFTISGPDQVTGNSLDGSGSR